MPIHRDLQIVDAVPQAARGKVVRPSRSSVLKVSEPSGSSMPLRTLIVDDEPIARKVLREGLDGRDDVEIVGEAENGAIALEKISEHNPDLVLLDLQMPVMGGLEVVRGLRRGTHMPVIVIVTAYDQYALQAFEAGAIDYLLKPVSEERLAEAGVCALHKQC